MKRSYLAYIVAPLAGLGLLAGAQVASAHGFFGLFGNRSATPQQIAANQQTAFQNEASLLGISLDDVKSA